MVMGGLSTIFSVSIVDDRKKETLYLIKMSIVHQEQKFGVVSGGYIMD